MEAWNQVFRIRYGGLTDTPTPLAPQKATPTAALPHSLAPYIKVPEESSSDSEEEEEEEGPVSMETSSVANWEVFQSEVSKQLLARHFYSCECVCVGV